MIYTSGTTGLPKGVTVTHGGLANLLREQSDRFVLKQDSRTLHFASPSFDASVLEVLLALAHGSTMVIAPTEVYGGEELHDFLAEFRVTHGFITPAALASVDPSGLDEFESVVVGGEACPPELVDRWAPGRRMFNGYGPTETTCFADIAGPMQPGDDITIGSPVRGLKSLVLDHRLQPVPVGVTGELYLSGPAMARGYHDRPGLTADRFIANPHGTPGDRMYRTGDVVRWERRDDRLEVKYIGRSDFQVKVRGFRIELGEIDAALAAHPDIEFASTSGATLPSGATALVAHVLASRPLDAKAVRDFVGTRLPSHMVPGAVVFLDEIPLTRSGKLDRAALPTADLESLAGGGIEPSTETERILAEVLAEVLGLPSIGVTDSFFDLGGNSLVATKAVARISALVGRRVAVREIFENPTVESLAVQLDSGPRATAMPDLVGGVAGERPPLSLAQQSMWLLNRLDPESAAYNIVLPLTMSGNVDIDALRTAISDVVARQQSLRTVFPDSADGPYQRVIPAAEVSIELPVVDVADTAEMRSYALRFVQEGFDVTGGPSGDIPPVRGVLLRSGAEHLLLVTVHHIVADGASMAPLARDLVTSYLARTAGGTPEFGRLPVQYTDFAQWQRRVLGSLDDPTSTAAGQLDFWRGRLAGLPEVLELPLDRSRPARRTMQGDAVPLEIPHRLVAALDEFAQRNQASLFMVVHALVATLLARLSNSTDITVGTPVGGRDHPDLEELVGMFVNTVVLRTEVNPEDVFGDLLGRVRAADLDAFANDDIPFESVVGELVPRRQTSHSPLFQVLLSFENNETARVDLPGLSVGVIDDMAAGAKFDLTITLDDTTDSSGDRALIGRLTFATDVFDRPTVEAISARLLLLAEAVADDPSSVVGDIDIRTATERLEDDAPGAAPVSAPKVYTARDLAALLAAAVDIDPDAIAIDHDGTRVTYREFNDRFAQLSGPLTERGMDADAIASVVLTGLVPTIMLAPEGFANALDNVIAAAATLVGDRDLADYRAPAGDAAPQDASATTQTPLSEWANRVVEKPGASAVRDPETALSRLELDQAANRLARELMSHGVGPDDVVGLLTPRSVNWVIGMLAAWKAGASYLPLDPAAPAERAAGVVADTGATVVVASHDVVTADFRTGLTDVGALLIELGEPGTDERLGRIDATPLPDRWAEPGAADRLAYVITTSGSTGRPKPTLVPAAGLLNMWNWYREQIDFGDGDAVLVASSPRFDLTQKNIWTALRVGGVIRLAREGFDPEEILGILRSERISLLNLAPSALELLVELDADSAIPQVTTVVAGGEALLPRAYRTLLGSPVRLMAAYGPTEAAATSSATLLEMSDHQPNEPGQVQDIGPIPLGLPIPNVTHKILDARLRPVPVGVVGELYIGGIAPARGYGGMFGLTAARFVADPGSSSGGRMYRTGDLVRRLPNGNGQFIGRSDFQVKVRGLRIELGEIEAALTAIEGIRQAVVSAHGESSDRRLAAHVAGAEDLDQGEIRAALSRALPDYMVPEAIVILPLLPLNANGKVDRKALPAPEFGQSPVEEFVAPRTPLEEIVAGVFADAVGVDRISVTASFFEQGGNSLSAARLANRLSDALGTTVALRDVFEKQSPAELAALVEQRRTGGSDSTVTPARFVKPTGPAPERIPLSLAQQRLWFINRYDPESGAYNIPMTLLLTGELDVEALGAAVVDLVERQQVIRTIYPESSAGPEQVVVPIMDALPPLRLDSIPQSQVWERLQAFSRIGFDVTSTVPFRSALWRIEPEVPTADGPDEHLLVIVVHHIASDGLSMRPLATDLLTAYQARRAGREPQWAPLQVQYADFAIWQQQNFGEGARPDSLAGVQLDFWRRNLADLPEVIGLPTDRPRTNVRSGVGASHMFFVPAELHQKVVDSAGANGLSTFMVFHAALALTLARSGAENDVAVGTPIGGRGAPELDALVGMFVNTLVLRTEVPLASTVAEFLAAVRARDLDAFEHSDVPFEQIVDALTVHRSTAHTPLIQVILGLNNTSRPILDVEGLSVTPGAVDTEFSKFDLAFEFTEQWDTEGKPAGLAGFLGYATDIFDRSTAQALAERLIRILDGMVADSGAIIGEIPLLDDRALAELVPVRGAAPAPAATLIELLDRASTMDPAGTALVCGRSSMTYRELDERSNRLARELISRGLGPEDVVALGITRSIESVLAVWAVVRSGATFVPVDPNYPADRVAHMLADSGATIGLTRRVDAVLLPDTVEWLDIDDPVLHRHPGGRIDPSERRGPVRTSNCAYIIYTSGTTGKPKGVEVTHGGLAAFSEEQRRRYGTDTRSRTLHFASPSFDASVLELLLATGAGATMIIVPPGVYGGAELHELLAENSVTHAFITPAALASVEPEGLPSFADISVGGEAVPADLVARWAPGRRLYNGYGPTETTIMTNISDPMVPGEPITIGGPIAGVSALVLDSRLRAVPAGVPGELYISGPGVSRAYRGRPDLTSHRFVANPYLTGERMYRTGDVVRWVEVGKPDGRTAYEVAYLGRSDQQVKVRGFRIELGEIDAVLVGHPAIDFAVTIGVEGPTGDTALAAYVKAKPGSTVDAGDLVDYAGGFLPKFMVPSSLVFLDEVPLTPVGKLDKRALPEPEFRGGATKHRDPSTPMEQAIAVAFADVLGVDSVGADDSFFDLGGNSLAATRAIARVNEILGIRLGVRILFEAPVVADLAEAIAASPDLDGVAVRPLTPQPRPDRIPLSLAQQRMWFVNRLNPDAADYNIPLGLRLRGDLDEEALAAALMDVIDRQEILRTVYPDSVQGPYQKVLPVAEAVPQLITRAVASEEELLGMCVDLATEGFDVTGAPPLRAMLLEVAPQDHVVLLVIHHIAADGSSLVPLATDLMAAYTARAAGVAPVQRPLSVQYADYAIWQRAVMGSEDDPDSLAARQISFWREHLSGMPELLDIPTDRPRTEKRSVAGGEVSFTIGEELQARLHTVARENETTMFMVIHAAYSILLARLSGSTDVAVGTPTAGRNATAVEGLVGMFVNTLVLRAQVRPSDSFLDTLAATKAADLAAFNNSELPFEQVVEAVAPVRSRKHAPLVQAMLTMQNIDIPTVTLPGLEVSGLESPIRYVKSDLGLTVSESFGADGRGRGIDAILDYAVDIFDESTVEAMAERFLAVVTAVAEDPDVVVGDIDILTESERRSAGVAPSAAEVEGFGSALQDLQGKSLSELLETAARINPDGIALSHNGTDVTYGALHAKSTELVVTLAAVGVGPEAAVTVALSTLLPGLLEGESAEGFADQFAGMLASVIAESGQGPAGRSTLVELFDERVALAPGNRALVDGPSVLTYAELDNRANRLARLLIARGVGPEKLVAIALDKNADLVVALLAVLKAGGGYLPIDTTHPRERLQFIFEDAAPTVLVTTEGHRAGLPVDLPPNVVLDDPAVIEELAAADGSTVLSEHRSGPLRSENTAYVIYTSGSTGRPKGVVVAHETVVALMRNTEADFGFDDTDVWTMFHSYAFDFSVWELWGPLLYGGALVMVDFATSRSPREFRELLVRERVTVLNQTPSAFYQLAEADRVQGSEGLSLRYVIFGGEALDLGQLDRWFARHGDSQPVLVNMYGITETTVHVTRIRLDREFAAAATSSVVGDAIAGLRVHVLDGRLHPVSAGVAGDLYVSGVQLTRGYLDRADLTSQRFVADPFGAPGARLYRSGDIARWNSRGQLEYLGRSDSQVQLRGFRVELGEVESALLRVDGVASAVALVDNGADAGEPGEDRLVAYVVPTFGAELVAADIRSAVGEFLTKYMVPDVVVFLDALPLTVNGKLDRAALPRPESAGSGRDHVEPRTAAERAVAEVYAEVARTSPVGATDSFFDIGGTSLGATRVAARVSAALGTEITVRDVFDHPTVAELAGLTMNRAGGSRVRRALVPLERPERIPLSLAQSRMWFINQFDTSSPAYNLPLPLRLSGELDVAALRAAIGDVAERHESLRTTFPDTADGPYQLIHPAQESFAGIYSEIEVRNTPEAIADELRRHALAGFDVTGELPLRIVLLHISDTEHILMLVAHHIAADGASMAPLFGDLVLAYEARRSGSQPDYAPLAVQYADFSIWQRAVLGDEKDPNSLAAQQIDFWRTALAGLPESVELPTDRQRPAMQSLRGASLPFTVPAPVRESLQRVARSHDVSMFMLMHAALAVLLERLSGQTDIAIGTPIAGRGEQDLDPLVGMFVNTVVLRAEVDPGETFVDLLDAVRASDIDAMAHGDIPFERLVEVLDVHRSTAHHPLFQIALSFDNNQMPELDLPGLRVSPVRADFDVAKFDLQLSIGDNDAPGDDIHSLFTYASDLFDESSVALFADRFVRILDAVADDPNVVVSDINVLGEDELASLTETSGPAGVAPETLPALLTRGVAENPDGVAVSYQGQTLTYTALDELTNRLARRLIALGAGPETVVALGVRRSLASIVGTWAIAKTGAAYLPINLDYPRERIIEMIEDSGTRFGVSASGERNLPASVDWYELDELEAESDGESSTSVTDADRDAILRLDHPAYLIYTSGSTGKPKAVVVTHHGLANLATDVREHYDVDTTSRFLHVASPSFDTSVGELLAAFSAGAALIVSPQDVFGGSELAELIAAERITNVVMTPTALMTVDPAGLDSVVSVVVGGDICPPELTERWSGALRNAYGPTEATVIVTITSPLAAGDRVTIGSPLRGVTTRVLDSRMRVVPRGVVGELYLAGPGIARGYHDRPQITAQRFVPDPYGEAGARLYRTGDLVRYSNDPSVAPNSLEYIGRSDFQVKVRGFRVELGEIDRLLDAHPDVDFAVTVGTPGPGGDTVLVSYILPKAHHEVDADALKRNVGEHLPQHMVPSVVMVLDSIPLTPIGKLDRRALPEPVFTVGDRVYRAPRNPVEETLAQVFAEVLDVDEVSIDESFFDLGGNSLSATKVVGRAGAALGSKIGVRELFAAPTIEELASRLAAGTDVRAQRPPLVARPRPVRIPLSLAQTRMWFLNRFDPDSAAYNIPAAVRSPGRAERRRSLRARSSTSWHRHESLRTVYPDSPSGPLR